MSTPQINWRLTLPILGSLIVHGCLFLSVAILTKTDSKKASAYRLSLKTHVHAPVLPAKPRAIERTTVIASVTNQSKAIELVTPAQVVMPAEACSRRQAGIQEDLSEPARRDHVLDAEYTSRAVEHGIEGDVVFDLTVGPDGQVQDAEIIKRLGYGLDENARAAILQSTFVAAKDRNGNAIAGRVIYKYKFRIENL